MNLNSLRLLKSVIKSQRTPNLLLNCIRCCSGSGSGNFIDVANPNMSIWQLKLEEHYDRHVLVTMEEAKRFMVDCFTKSHTTPENAQLMAEMLVEADHIGHYSHGMNRLEMYINDLLHHIVDGEAVPKIIKDKQACAWVDGKNGLGAVIGAFCMDLAIKKAKEVGFGWIVAKRSNHYGIASYYTKRALNEGLIGWSMTNTSPLMSPTRSAEPALGTNCLAFAAPGTDKSDDFNLDMSTTGVAMGKIEMQKRKEEPIPLGWALDREGHMTSDPEEAYSLMPMGGSEVTSGFKGYGLSAMVEICCGILGGANYSKKIRPWSTTGSYDEANLGQCFIALNPECFAPGFSKRLGDMHNILRTLTPATKDAPVLIPGDPERIHMNLVKTEGGLRYTHDQIETNEEIARRLKVDHIKFKEI